ncbi:PfkB family carbohydrate kinase [Herpetosiphon sp. NSE202]|uniref:PfkB family carbohydrate kinase n=1 Tax=Herpetosiphon sp. NSE202 TaxID=3351349 RepID=UPI00363D0FC8
MTQALCLGELLVDFVPTEAGLGVANTPLWQRAAGGAPANVAVGLARLGMSSGFLGMVGADSFGDFLAETLAAHQVDIQGLRRTEQARTALAFVALQADGERDFMFYRHPSADMLFAPSDLEPRQFATAKLLHFGSLSASNELGYQTTLRAIELAQANGMLLSFDPNLRAALWPSLEAARSVMLKLLPYAHIIKLSREEAEFLTALADPLAAAQSLWHERSQVIVVTDGSAGCWYQTATGSGRIAAPTVHAIDATGAGDSFVACLLAQLIQQPTLAHDQADFEHALQRASIAGALATLVRGAIPGLPTAEQIEQFRQ